MKTFVILSILLSISIFIPYSLASGVNDTINNSDNSTNPLKFYKISASSDDLGEIIPSGDVIVVSGKNRSFKIRQKSGAFIDKLLVDGKPEKVLNDTYVFLNVTADHNITVQNKAEEGAIILNFKTKQSDLIIRFNGTAYGNPDQWHWSFGDGNTSDLQNSSNIYPTHGNYTVTLWARNNNSTGNTVRDIYV